MSDEFQLKSMSIGAVDKALERAEHYRLLNDPAQAESVCLDVLEVDPENQRCLTVLLLAMTDQFVEGAPHAGEKKTREYLGRMKDEYRRVYYTGIVHERKARAFLARGLSGVFAYESFVEAMAWYEKAEPLRPAGTDDPILRWNNCVRSIQRRNLRPIEDHWEQPLE